MGETLRRHAIESAGRAVERRASADALILATLLVWAPPAASGAVRFVLAGDILLSHLVAAEIGRTGASPWKGMTRLFLEADWIAGNLEGAVGSPDDCPKNGETCFAIAANDLATLKAGGFHALGNEGVPLQ